MWCCCIATLTHSIGFSITADAEPQTTGIDYRSTLPTVDQN